eukprot:6186392-Pleurochrysis_carterae.AAC.1
MHVQVKKQTSHFFNSSVLSRETHIKKLTFSASLSSTTHSVGTGTLKHGHIGSTLTPCGKSSVVIMTVSPSLQVG